MINTFLYSIMLLSATAMASFVEPPFPGPTNVQEGFAMLVHEAMPAPTEPPVLRFDWFRRQTSFVATDASATSETDLLGNGTSSASQIGWLAPDNTCGYIGGRIGAALTCSTTEYCAAATLLGSVKMACCPGATSAQCTFFETCIDYSAYYTASVCDHACLEDVNTMKCLSSAFPYCYPYTVPGIGALYYSCDAVTTNVPQPFLTTFNGENDGRSWTPVYNTSTASVLTNTEAVSPTATDGRTSTGAGLEGGNTASSLTGGAGDTTTGTTTSTPSSTSAPASQNKSSTPVGAIVGGVVGGLAVIAIAAGAITYFCLKSRRQRPSAAPVEAQQPAMATAAPVQQDYYKQPDTLHSPVPPRYSHIEQPGELSGDYHQPVFNAQGVQAHELGSGQQSMH